MSFLSCFTNILSSNDHECSQLSSPCVQPGNAGETDQGGTPWALPVGRWQNGDFQLAMVRYPNRSLVFVSENPRNYDDMTGGSLS